MTGSDFTALLPLIILAVTAIVVMVGAAIRRSHALSASLTLIGLAISIGSLWIAAPLLPRQVTPLLMMDHYAVFYIGLIAASSIITVLLAYGYFEKYEGSHDELYILILVATLGSAVLVASSHFVSLFLGLELLSVSLYAMIAYPRRRPLPLEAGIKYLVLAAVSAAFLLFGMALVYGAFGTMEFGEIAARLARPDFNLWLVLPGTALIITGFGFKLALAPFHLWTPDVYEGAPAPVSAYIATVSKGAMFALLLRYFYQTGSHELEPLHLVFSIIAIASMFGGNILALLQNNVKRILAYSSIAHLGYLLVAFQASGDLAPTAVAFYLVAYFVTTFGAFGVVTVLSDGTRDADLIEDYRGLFWRRPAIAAIFTAMLFSLAGIPVTAGFIGKFYVVAAGASAAMWSLVVILVVTSAIGLFYYLRIVVALYSQSTQTPATTSLARPGVVSLIFLSAALIYLGLFPSPLLALIHRLMPGLI
ncbi:MAG: NADH-quinone oxidoreductase subunit N [Bryobacterales bacterium]|nr:NADH-quinone oxidoreductase subunit N [Bryobacterales bacterium]